MIWLLLGLSSTDMSCALFLQNLGVYSFGSESDEIVSVTHAELFCLKSRCILFKIALHFVWIPRTLFLLLQEITYNSRLDHVIIMLMCD
ncbi:hypothetical protein M758_5G003800 [Ceratodon purpureus]|nr:hypothetical protein M758_5G003800 [Ceratodon purpureus]